MLLNSVLNEAVLEPTLAQVLACRTYGLAASSLCVNDDLEVTRYLSMRAKSLIVMM